MPGAFAAACIVTPAMLTDGGIETRLIYEDRLDLPEFASFLPLLRDGERAVLAAIYDSYLAVAAESGLPMQVGTPTWRAHPECLARLGLSSPGDLAAVNGKAVALLQERRRLAGLEDRVFIAGVIGPRRDGYDPAAAPVAEEAADYHRAQAEVFAGLGVDLLYAPTFAAAGELRGAAAAMAGTGLDYVLAPVIGEDGALLDGTGLDDAVAAIDGADHAAPLHYMAGCVHPARFRRALPSGGPPLHGRLAGLKANASDLPPEELDRLDHLDEGVADAFGRAMAALHASHGLRVLGGCCGTNQRHIRALARHLRDKSEP